MLRINNKSPLFESLVFSKAHDTWASNNEFEQLHRLLAYDRTRHKDKAIAEPAPVQNTDAPKAQTGVHGKKIEPTDQVKLENELIALIRKWPNNSFYRSLKMWKISKGDFTSKQAAAIHKNYEELVGRKPMFKDDTPVDDAEEDIESNITDDERNDPNWTPW